MKDTVTRACTHLPKGQSPTRCDDCGEPIPEHRRQAVPGVRTEMPCQSERDTSAAHSPYHRPCSEGTHPPF